MAKIRITLEEIPDSRGSSNSVKMIGAEKEEPAGSGKWVALQAETGHHTDGEWDLFRSGKQAKKIGSIKYATGSPICVWHGGIQY